MPDSLIEAEDYPGSQQLVLDDPQNRIKHNSVATHLVFRYNHNTGLGGPKGTARDLFAKKHMFQGYRVDSSKAR